MTALRLLPSRWLEVNYSYLVPLRPFHKMPRRMWAPPLLFLAWPGLFCGVRGTWDDEDDEWGKSWKPDDTWENQWSPKPNDSATTVDEWEQRWTNSQPMGVTSSASSSSSTLPAPVQPLPYACPSATWTSDSVASAGGATSSSSTWRPWTHEEIMAMMAERWDENISLALQDEVMQEAIMEDTATHLLPPIPEDLPLPFLVNAAENLKDDEKWWEKVRDRRRLRGQDGVELRPHGGGLHGEHPGCSSTKSSSSSSSPTASTSSTTPVTPSASRLTGADLD